MKELLELLIKNPLHGIVTIILMVVTMLFLSMITVEKAVAVLEIKQEGDADTREIVLEMREVIIRVEESNKFIREDLSDIKDKLK